MEKAELIRNFFFIKRDAKNSLCVGGNQEIIGGNQNRVSGTVENTEAYKSDSLHLLHDRGFRNIFSGSSFPCDILDV